MKKKNIFLRMLALVLTLAMVFSVTGGTFMEAIAEGVSAVNESKTVEGDVEGTAYACAGEGQSASLTVEGNVETVTAHAENGTVTVQTGDASTEDEYAHVVDVYTSGDKSDADVTVGDVTSEGLGIYTNNHGGEITAETGAVTAERWGVEVYAGDDWQSDSLSADAFNSLNLGSATSSWYNEDGSYGYSYEDSEGNVYHRNIASDGTETYTKETKVSRTGTTDLTTGAVTVNNTDEAWTEGISVYVDGEKQSASVTVNGDASVQSVSATGADITANNGNGSLTVNGDLSVSGDESASGASCRVDYQADGNAELLVNGDVTVIGGNYASGLSANGGGDVDVHVTGDLTVSSDGWVTVYESGYTNRGTDYGITAYNSDPDGDKTVTVDGSVSVSSKDNSATGIMTDCANDLTVTVGGNLSTDGYTARGMSIDAYGDEDEDGTITVSVGGNVTADGDTHADGVYIYGNGNVKVEVGGNVETTSVKNDGTRYSSSEDIGVLVSGSSAGKERDIDIKGSVMVSSEGTGAEGVYVSGSGENNITIGGDVSATGALNARGVNASNSVLYYDYLNEEYKKTDGQTTVAVTGNVIATVTGENRNACGIEEYGNGKTEVTVSGNLSATGSSATGASVTSSAGSFVGSEFDFVETDGQSALTVNGSVTATSTGEGMNATGIRESGNGKQSVAVSGDVKAKGDSATGIQISSEGYTSRSFYDEETDSYRGINLDTDGKSTAEIGGSIIAEGKDRATGIDSWGSGDVSVHVAGDIITTSDGKIYSGGDTDDPEYTWHGNDIGISSYSDNYFDAADSRKEIAVDGSVIVTTEDNNARGIETGGNGNSRITVGGDVKAEGDQAYGISASAYTSYSYDNNAEETATSVAVGGNVTADGDRKAFGIQASSNEGTVTTVTVDGGVTTTSEGGTDYYITEKGNRREYALTDTGVYAYSLDGKTTVTVGQGVDATSETNQVTGVQVSSDGKDAEVDVTVKEGGVSASTEEGEWATAIQANNWGGSVSIDVTGDVESTGAGINVNNSDALRTYIDWPEDFEMNEAELVDEYEYYDEDDELVKYKKYFNKEGGFFYDNNGNMWTAESNTGETSVHVVGDVILKNGEYYSAIYINAYDDEAENKSTVNVEVEGDVSGGKAGAWLDIPSETAEVNLIVDGTMSGEESAIVLGEETTGEDNLTITVWELKPNEDGNLVERVVGGDEETGEPLYERDEEAEKKLQYIIRIAQPDIISTEGTTDYEGYLVANEGDTVYVKINIPDGYTLDEVWQNEGQTISVVKDGDGNYYLAVPRGGGVSLSVTLSQITNHVEEEKEEKVPVYTPVQPKEMTNEEISAAVEELLTKNDLGIEADVSVETSADGNKTVVIAPATIEEDEGNTVLQLTVPMDMIQTLGEQKVTKLKMTSSNGTANIEVPLAEVQNALEGKTAAQLIVVCENQPELAETVVNAISEKYKIKEGTTVVLKVAVREPDGTETELSNANFFLNLFIEYEEGMKILYVDAEGNIVETEAVWVEATEDVPGHWEVPYLGNGSYIPVVDIT